MAGAYGSPPRNSQRDQDQLYLLHSPRELAGGISGHDHLQKQNQVLRSAIQELVDHRTNLLRELDAAESELYNELFLLKEDFEQENRKIEDAKKTKVKETSSSTPSAIARSQPAISEYEGHLLDFCKHRRRDNLQKGMSGILLCGRYVVERVAKAIPHYNVVMLCEEAYMGRKVWAKFLWKTPGHRDHRAFCREFYVLQYLWEHGIRSVPMVRTFNATVSSRIAMGVMDALNGHLLEDEFAVQTKAKGEPPSSTSQRSHSKEGPKSQVPGPPSPEKSQRPRSRPVSSERSQNEHPQEYHAKATKIVTAFSLDPSEDAHGESRLGMTTFRAAFIADELLRCLIDCHKLGLVCADVRPNSILMEDFGFDGKTSLRLLDWGHSWVKDPKATLGEKYMKELHRVSVNLARTLQNAVEAGTLSWVEQSLKDLKARLEYMSTEQFEQLADSGKSVLSDPQDEPTSPKGGLQGLNKLLDGIDKRQASDPSEETDIFMAGMTILRCFRNNLDSTKASVRADLISATQNWIEGVLPRNGELMDAMVAAVEAASRSDQSDGVAAMDTTLTPRRHPGIEISLQKALQCRREQRYTSIAAFREVLIAETMVDDLTEEFLLSHKDALKNGFWPLMRPLTKPQVWRVFDVVTRVPRPAFTHVTMGGFHLDTPEEDIRQLARVFSKKPFPWHESWPPIQVYWEGVVFPCQYVKLEWCNIIASRMAEFLLLLIENLDLAGSPVDNQVDLLASCLMNKECVIDVLDLSSCKMFDKNILILAPALPPSLTLHSLNLANNSLTDLSVMTLVECLVQNSSVRYLNLAENSLSRKSALALAGLFGDPEAGEHGAGERRRAAPLESLELNRNCLVGGGISLGRALQPSATGRCPLKFLGLNENGLNEHDAGALAAGLAPDGSLSVLSLGSNLFGRRGVRAVLEPVVKTLTLSFTSTIYQDIDGMAQNSTPLMNGSSSHSRVLQSLDIAQNGVQEEEPHEWLRSIFHEIDIAGQVEVLGWYDSTQDQLISGKPTIQLRCGPCSPRHNVLPGEPAAGHPLWPNSNGPTKQGTFQIWTE